MSWGIGEARRELVIRFARSMRVSTLERSIASLPGGLSHAAGAMRRHPSASNKACILI